jgi:DNA-binding CsgD family transcriptional regulator
VERLDPSEILELASAAGDARAFGAAVLGRFASAVGFDVAYHASPLPSPRVRGDPLDLSGLAAVGLSEARRRELVVRGSDYTHELMPVKRAAILSGGVAVDSEVLGSRKRERLGYYTEMMRPEGGRHAMFVVGTFRGEIASVTMLGRCGSAFSATDADAMRAIVPALALATLAHASVPKRDRRPAPALRPLERDLVDYVSLGFTNAEIARARGTSPRTVRNQLSALYARLGVANRAELVATTNGAR